MNENERINAILAFHKLKMEDLKRHQRCFPDFIGIGPGRTGSSALYRALVECSEICMSPVKEVNYFGFRSFDALSRPWGAVPEEYATYFSGGSEYRLRGEISPAYFILPQALTEIEAMLPEIKIICGLRNPIHRLVSQYKLHSNEHGFTNLDDYVGCAKESISRIDSLELMFHWYHPVRALASSIYAPTLRRARSLFGKDRMFVYRFEEFIRSSEVLNSLFEFLDIDRRVELPPTVINASPQETVGHRLSTTNATWLGDTLSRDIDEVSTMIPWDFSGYSDITASLESAGVSLG